MELGEATRPDEAPISREQLYREVWAEPMTKVAARYSVSSSFLARVCTRLNVPRPERGYWAKLAVGQKVRQPSLPEPRPGDELEWARGISIPKVAEAVEAPAVPEKKAKIMTVPRLPKASRHPLIQAATPHFDKSKELEDGFLRPSKLCMADVLASKATLKRVLDTASTFFQLLEANDHRVLLASWHAQMRRPGLNQCEEGVLESSLIRYWSPDRPTIAYFGSLAIGLTVFETSEKVVMRYLDSQYVRETEATKKRAERLGQSWSWTTTKDLPSGRLCIRAYSPYRVADWSRQWRETTPGELPGLLEAVVQELESEAPAIAKLVENGEREAEEAQRKWEAEWAEWKRKDEEEQRAKRIKASRDELLAVINKWSEIKNIEAFFQDAERRAGLLSESDRLVVVEKLEQARALIGEADALEALRAWKFPSER